MSWMAYAGLAATQIAQGYAQKKEYEYAQDVQEAKAKGIEQSQQIEAQKYERLKQQYAGKVTAATAAGGLEMKGSPAEVLVDSLTQIEMDKQIGQYNLELKKRFAKSKGRYYGYKGTMAMYAGIGQAGLTMGSYYAKKSSLAKTTKTKTTSGVKTGGYGRIKSYGAGKYLYQPKTGGYLT